MSAFDSYPRASFGGVEFPLASYDVQGGIRSHVHEYPHAEGGATEKLGRSLYKIKVEAIFDSRFPGYPNLWPKGRDDIMGHCENQSTLPLVIPSLLRGNPINCYCVSWTIGMNAKVRSGERMTMEFVEDWGDAAAKYVFMYGNNKFSSAATSAIKSVDPKSLGLNKQGTDLFAAFQSAVDFMAQAKGFADLSYDLVMKKVEQISSMAEQLVDYVLIKSPFDTGVLQDSIKAAWEDAVDIQQANKQEAQTFVVPSRMSIAEAALAIYGDTAKQDVLYQLNSAFINDPGAIEPNTRLVYFE